MDLFKTSGTHLLTFDNFFVYFDRPFFNDVASFEISVELSFKIFFH